MKKVVYLAALTVLFGCAKEEKKKPFEMDLNLTGEMLQVNTQTVIQDEANANNFYSKVDSIVKYGYGYKLILPDSLKETNLKVIISADVKETESISGEFVISINEPNMNNLYWGNRPVAVYLKDLNIWKPYKDSIIIGSNQNPKKNSHLYIFNTKFSGGGSFCVDNFKVKIIKQ
jgi:hypothetical protein